MASKVFLITGNAGQGKTTIAKNIALAMRSFGFDVLLVDGDPRTPKLRFHTQMPLADKCIQDALTKKRELREVIYTRPSGLKVVLGSYVKGAPHPSTMFEELQAFAGVVVVDVPMFDASWYACGEVVAVTHPDFPSLLEVNRLAKQARISKVIINRSYDDESDISPGNAQHVLEAPIAGVVPDEPQCRHALKQYAALLDVAPQVRASVVLKAIAAKLLNVSYTPPGKEVPLLVKLGVW